jgi:hypothetical protein
MCYDVLLLPYIKINNKKGENLKKGIELYHVQIEKHINVYVHESK